MKSEAGIFKALADETRLRIVLLLLDGELCVCEIIAALALPQSTVSRHLAYLKRTGWVRDRRQGVWMYYSLDEKNVLIRALQPIIEKKLAGSRVHAAALARLKKFQKQQNQQVCDKSARQLSGWSE
jgi:ArsR family transcriptional regulator